jgi:hypothetical protein
MSVPADWSRTVGRVAAEPAWSDLFNILGTLVAPGTAWTCWRVGIAFRNGTIGIVIARARHSTPEMSQNWSDNLWTSVLSKMRDYAGRRYVLPAALVDAMSDTGERVKSSPYWTKYDHLPAEDPRRVNLNAEKIRVVGGVDVLVSLAKLVAAATTQGKVLSTVLWYDPNRPSIPATELGGWKPLHAMYDAWQNRAVHYWWNSGCEIAAKPGFFSSYPFVYSGSLKLRGWEVTDVAHAPWELAAAFYPLGNWPAPAVAALEAGTQFTSFEAPPDLMAMPENGQVGPVQAPAADGSLDERDRIPTG